MLDRPGRSPDPAGRRVRSPRICLYDQLIPPAAASSAVRDQPASCWSAASATTAVVAECAIDIVQSQFIGSSTYLGCHDVIVNTCRPPVPVTFTVAA